MFSKILNVAALASMASGHIILTNPVPYAGYDSSPLEASGSNFPCKNPSYSAAGGGNSFAAGSTQQLSFMGSAVHGGGSCQVSVTKDNPPTADSVWKVIHSIEGGCVARNQAGNYPENPNLATPDKYDFQIPQQLEAGDYVLAWTWFNKIGNREMYMNCAPLTVTGGSGDAGFYDTLPDMFTANIGNDCTTVEGSDTEFPNPGQSVSRNESPNPSFGPPSGSCPGGGGGGGGQPTPTPTPTPGAQAPGAVFVPQPTQVPTPDNSDNSDNEDAPKGGNPPGTACFEDGAWNCIDGGGFQRCASGTWSAVQPMAAGVGCQAGQSSELQVNAKSGLRAMRRSLRVRA